MTEEAAVVNEEYASQHEELLAKLEKLAANNVAIEEDLIKQRVQPNPFVLLTMRLNLLLDTILGGGESNARLAYEVEAAKRTHDILMHIQQQKLVEKATPKLIIPELRPK